MIFCIEKLYFRLQTVPNNSQTSLVFSTAAPNSDFGKVFQNNMDDMSYSKDSNIFPILFNNRKTVGWTDQSVYLGSQEFENCEVCTIDLA